MQIIHLIEKGSFFLRVSLDRIVEPGVFKLRTADRMRPVMTLLRLEQIDYCRYSLQYNRIYAINVALAYLDY